MMRVAALPLAICLGIALSASVALGPGVFIPVMLGLILVGGLPHGGLDLLLASGKYPLVHPRDYVLFVLVYLGLAAAVASVWSLAPNLALAAFLGYSALHFGSDWDDRSVLGGWAAGLALLAQPALASPLESARLFSALGAEGAMIRQALVVASLVALPLVLWVLRREPWRLALFAILGAVAVVLHPLAWFFVYFCGVHGPLHMQRICAAREMSTARLVRHWIGPALAAGAVIAAAAVGLWQQIGLERAMLQSVFIGLASLTVPHMLLVDLVARRPRSDTRREPRGNFHVPR